MLGGVGVPSADVFVLEGFELLLCAKFVGLKRRKYQYMQRQMRQAASSRSYHLVRLFEWFASWVRCEPLTLS